MVNKREKRSIPVSPPRKERKLLIDMNRMNLKKEHTVPSFKTDSNRLLNLRDHLLAF